MKTLALLLLLPVAALAQDGGEPRARTLYAEGRHAESMAAWQELIALRATCRTCWPTWR